MKFWKICKELSSFIKGKNYGFYCLIYRKFGIHLIRYQHKKWLRTEKTYNNNSGKESGIFFEKNKERVENLLEILSDQKSKDVFEAMIRFRCIKDYKLLPKIDWLSQYFFNDFFLFKSEEKLIDCGAFNGDSILSFVYAMKKQKRKIQEIVAFEPDYENYAQLRKNYPDVISFNCGVWEQDTILRLYSGKGDASYIISSDNKAFPFSRPEIIEIPVRSIDNCKECEGATIIKMDIEGSELSALKGARKIIEKNRPKLAICIYHSDEDMLCIAEWIHEIVPEYKLYIRQHSDTISETILYATI